MEEQGKSNEEIFIHHLKGFRANQKGILDLYDTLSKNVQKLADKVESIEEGLNEANYAEKLQELRAWKKELNDITPLPILKELVEEMKKNRDLRTNILQLIKLSGGGIAVNLLLNALEFFKK